MTWAEVDVMLELGLRPRGAGAGPRHRAAWVGSVACVDAALQHAGVRVLINLPDPTHGSTPLSWCCHGAQHCEDPNADHPPISRLLLEPGARADGTCGRAPAVDCARKWG